MPSSIFSVSWKIWIASQGIPSEDIYIVVGEALLDKTLRGHQKQKAETLKAVFKVFGRVNIKAASLWQ